MVNFIVCAMPEGKCPRPVTGGIDSICFLAETLNYGRPFGIAEIIPWQLALDNFRHKESRRVSVEAEDVAPPGLGISRDGLFYKDAAPMALDSGKAASSWGVA
ncbi:MAG TPA: hypothetical protein VFV81_02980 [Verrucomicrobiae bacterium]|nr:hypothetical protein [Verrucomicrobiae bacterium]